MNPLQSVGSQHDETMIQMWLHGKSPNSLRLYRRVVDRFYEFTNKKIKEVNLQDIQRFELSLNGLSDASKASFISIVKSFIAFAHRMGYIKKNVAVSVQPPKELNALAVRILSKEDVCRMITQEPKMRNRAMLQFMYATGVRVSEVCRLRWKDIRKRSGRVTVTVYGKGRKTRFVSISEQLGKELKALRDSEDENGYVFSSQIGKGCLDQSQVNRIVKAAAKRAGISSNVSPHWLRHSHASHSLDRGCPIHVLQKTLGHSSVKTTARYLLIQSV